MRFSAIAVAAVLAFAGAEAFSSADSNKNQASQARQPLPYVLPPTPNSYASNGRQHMHYVSAAQGDLKPRQDKIYPGIGARNITSPQGTTCRLPTNSNLVAVTPGQQNKGFAMAPNKPCKAGMYCPYACKPGMQMAQWNPASTYADSTRVDGGVKCNPDGSTSKPFPNKPYCIQGKDTVSVRNKASQDIAFCQTVLPGYEDMLIPTNAARGRETVLDVPGLEYWQKTSAHYFVNAPGVSTHDGCVWGEKTNPVGNWAPYVAGANVDGTGITYMKIGWNPVYLEPESRNVNVKPKFGIKIQCDGDGSGCSGLPCSIDPSVNGINQMTGPSVVVGAGGATGCTIGVSAGHKAFISVWDVKV